MRTEVGEWLATCVGSPICILLLSWSLLIYQDQPSSSKRRIDVLTVAILLESLVHQLGLLLYAILTLILPINNFSGEYRRYKIKNKKILVQCNLIDSSFCWLIHAPKSWPRYNKRELHNIGHSFVKIKEVDISSREQKPRWSERERSTYTSSRHSTCSAICTRNL